MPNIFEAAMAKSRPPSKRLARAGNKAAQQMLLQELQELENHAHRLGLHVTAHALNRAKNAMGWEMAGNVEQAGKAAARC